MSDATLRLVERLRDRIQETRRRLYLSRLSRGGVITVGIAAATLLVALLIEAYFWLPPSGRLLMVGVVGAAIAMPLGLMIGKPLAELIGVRTGLTEETVARNIGNAFESVGDRLINLLHLAEGRGSISDDALREEAICDLGADVRDVPFEQLATFEKTRKALRWALPPVTGLFLFALIAPGTVSNAGHRLLSPGTSFERPAPFSWTVTPGDSTLVRGETLTISARPEGRELPGTAVLKIQREDETHVEETKIQADSTRAFRHQQSSVRHPLRYRVASGRVTSRWYTVDIVNRPLVRELQISLIPPSYTDLPERTLAPNVGDISALPGTRVNVTVTSDSNQLADAYLVFEKSDTTDLSVDGARAHGSFTIDGETTYNVGLQNQGGITNGSPIQYQITTLTDEAPSIEFQSPPAVSDIEQNGQKTLQMRLTDDYGFRELRLYYRLSESRFDETTEEFGSISLPLENPDQLDQALEYTWRIAEETELDPVRGDVIEYYAEVSDNNAIAGYRRGTTATQVLRFPSLAQQYEGLNQDQESVESSLESLREETDAMRKEFQSLQQDVRQRQESSWDNQQSLEQLKERQRSMEKQAQEVNRQVEEMTRQMENENLVSEQTLQMYKELQKVVEEIDSPELQKALQKLQEAMENMDFESMQQALQNVEFNEQEYQQRLERTLELFEKLRTQQQLDEVAHRTNDLAEQERKLAEQTEQLSPEAEQGEGQDEGENDSDQSDSSEEETDTSGPADETSETDGEPSEDSAETSSNQDRSSESSDASAFEDSPSTGDSAAQDQQSSSADSSSAGRSADQLAEQQERSREEMEAIEQRMEELREQMEDMQQSPLEEFQRMQEQMERQNLPQQMQENSEQLRQQQFNQAQQGQRSMQQQLQKMSQQMSQMQQSMQSQQLQVNIAGIRQALEDVLHLSDEQENLRQRVNNLADDSPVLREISQTQTSLSEGLSTVNDSLQSLAGDIPRMSQRIQRRSGEALQAMSRSVETITERNLPQSTTHQRVAMEHLNNLAVDLSQLLEQLQNMQQQGGSGNMSMQQMMQQMQQMAGQQEKLNQQIQQMLNDIQGDRLSQNQQERLNQMRRQQQQIRRQLEELQNNSSGSNDLLGDLEKVAEQMEESIRELRERSVSRDMVERQKQILSRLLQAQQSLQTQGEEERRRSQTGDDITRDSPDPLSPAEQTEQLRRDLLRALESGYASDYEELIKRYFQQLRERDGE